MNNLVLAFVFGYIFSVLVYGVSALIDRFTVNNDNKILFRKILKSILKGIESDA